MIFLFFILLVEAKEITAKDILKMKTASTSDEDKRHAGKIVRCIINNVRFQIIYNKELNRCCTFWKSFDEEYEQISLKNHPVRREILRRGFRIENPVFNGLPQKDALMVCAKNKQ